MTDNDREIFRDAIQKLPPDLLRMKYGQEQTSKPSGSPRSSKPEYSRIIDLHGRTREEAIVILRTALKASSGKKHRLLFITGRGIHSENGIGILTSTVTGFLEKEGARYIEGWNRASSKNGGEGAIEVFTC